jgi:hypothetical protein
MRPSLAPAVLTEEVPSVMFTSGIDGHTDHGTGLDHSAVGFGGLMFSYSRFQLLFVS